MNLHTVEILKREKLGGKRSTVPQGTSPVALLTFVTWEGEGGTLMHEILLLCAETFCSAPFNIQKLQNWRVSILVWLAAIRLNMDFTHAAECRGRKTAVLGVIVKQTKRIWRIWKQSNKREGLKPFSRYAGMMRVKPLDTSHGGTRNVDVQTSG